ncbi:unnamed protein product [Lactuca virosa]|uniref:YTH domain-containing family protein n=1 Tax=Lactuca virosa TaxID=75947 RepID=A0AAU9P5H9_9ASTR|nr:unnamed protein product [Lactuca virosa]
MPRYLWNSTYSDARYQNSTSWGSKSAMVSNGLMKSNGFSYQRFPNYPLDIQSTSNISRSFLQTPQLCSVNKSGGVAKGINHAQISHLFSIKTKTKYEQAKFYIIKSYSEDDVHKCVKYDVWSSTPNGNKKLDIAFLEAEGKRRETEEFKTRRRIIEHKWVLGSDFISHQSYKKPVSQYKHPKKQASGVVMLV